VAVRDAPSAAAAGRALRSRGIGTVIVTLGAQGALACTAQGDIPVPAFAVTAVDTTAAGDAFNGALGAGLAARRTLPDALRFASAAAALACTRRGAQPSLPTAAEVARMLDGA
jgi:ribokinase